MEVSPGMASFAVAVSPLGAPGATIVVVALVNSVLADAAPVPAALIALTR